MDLVLASSRVGIAAVYFFAGRTKVSGFIDVTDGAVGLFQNEYRLPWVDPVVAARRCLRRATLTADARPRTCDLPVGAHAAGNDGGLEVSFIPMPDRRTSAGPPLLLLPARGAGAWSLDRAFGLR